MYKIALFASGSETNVENIANHFKDNKQIEISLVLSNRKDAYVLERAKKLNIPSLVFNREQFNNTNEIVTRLSYENVDLIVLAGFLWLIPQNLIEAFPNKIINIHPALLPKYGGKGMYGSKVHEAVVTNKDSKSGITIHFVNEKYDEGEILLQNILEIQKGETWQELELRIKALEAKTIKEFFTTLCS